MIESTRIAEAALALARGELVVFPTETLYAIGCDALDGEALERLAAAKRRPADKGIAVVLADAAMLEAVAETVGSSARRLAERFWPGPLTVLVPARAGLPPHIVREARVGCRVSADPIARELSARLGRPIASPSANPADAAPARDVAAARRYFGAAVSVYLDDGPRWNAPSTLVDPGPPLRIFREGAISASEIQAALA